MFYLEVMIHISNSGALDCLAKTKKLTRNHKSYTIFKDLDQLSRTFNAKKKKKEKVIFLPYYSVVEGYTGSYRINTSSSTMCPEIHQ
jgi:hypothetical protein